MAFFTQKVWVEWIEQGLANGEYNFYNYKDLVNVEQIGSSKVYKSIIKKEDDDDVIVAMKYIGNKLSTREVQSELKLLRKIQFFNNDYISNFYGITKSDSTDKNQLKYMVMLEYGDGGSLREYLQNNSENLHWGVRLKFARQLSKAIEFLHEKNLIHKNLHSHNIIISQQDLKLNALGITCKMKESSNISTNLQNYLAYVDPQYFKIPSYKSTEDKQSTLTKKSDIYSLGILLWELSSMKLPFSSEEHSDLQKEIMEGLREKDIDGIDPDYIVIYKKCWQNEPDDRPEILEVVSALEKLDDVIDPSMVQENKKVKPKRRFSMKEPPAPDPPVIKPVKSSKRPQVDATPPPVNTTPPTSKPQVNTTPPTPKPQVDPTPPPPQKPQVDTTPPPPKPQINTTPPPPQKPQVNTPPQIDTPPQKPQVNTPPQIDPPPPKPQVNTPPQIDTPPPKPQVITPPQIDTPPPKPQVITPPQIDTPPPKPQVITPPQIDTPPPKPQVITPPQIDTPPPKPQIITPSKPQSNTTPPSIITTKNSNPTLTVPNIRHRSRSPRRDSPKLRSKSPEATIIEEDEGEGESTRINSPVGSETSTISVTYQSPISKSFISSVLKSESPRSLSPNKKSNIIKEKSPVRQSRPIGRTFNISPSRKSLTRAVSPNFTTREPRSFRRSSSVSLPRNAPKTSRRAQTVAPPQPRLPSPPRYSIPKKPANRRHSTSVISVINSPLQINAQSSLTGLWSNTSDRREDPTKKIIDELLSLFMETYEVDPGDALLKSVQEFLEDQKEETDKIFDWLLTTQLSIQYEILLGYFYLNGIGTSVANRKAFVLFLSAAKKQYAIAQDLLGYCYLNGKGTVKDEILAFEWYQKAAANGCVTAFQSLGECYHNGTGTVKNKGKALQYFKLASDGGNVCGKNMLAFCYEMGLGISSDHKKAFSLYKQAADAGYKLAKQNVAKCYQKGIGIAVDLEAAAYWMEK